MPLLQNRKTVAALFFLVALGFAACTQKVNKEMEPPADLIPRDTMVSIFVDLRLLDAVVNAEQRKSNPKLQDVNYFLHNSILEKYKITREQFEASYTYYQTDLAVLDGIYADAITRLSLLKTKTQQEESGP